jgi:hypothetical protein
LTADRFRSGAGGQPNDEVLDPGVEEGPDHVRDLGGLAGEGACRGAGSLMPRGGPHRSQAARACSRDSTTAIVALQVTVIHAMSRPTATQC